MVLIKILLSMTTAHVNVIALRNVGRLTRKSSTNIRLINVSDRLVLLSVTTPATCFNGTQNSKGLFTRGPILRNSRLNRQMFVLMSLLNAGNVIVSFTRSNNSESRLNFNILERFFLRLFRCLARLQAYPVSVNYVVRSGHSSQRTTS